DGRPGMQPALALAHIVLRTNERIEPAAALLLAGAAVRAARRNGLPPDFLGATLLQESAFDPNAISSAGAIGIAQFTIPTAIDHHVDPFEPYAAIDGAARLLGEYVSAYRGRYADPFSIALAAYNAGPGAVARYDGIPPYPETREYIQDIDERWGEIAAFEVRGPLLSKHRP
ncbi:MAG: lytic transglycosylase domain-containing protein, partial [Vulcanimicrobiaceae bacterium]